MSLQGIVVAAGLALAVAGCGDDEVPDDPDADTGLALDVRPDTDTSDDTTDGSGEYTEERAACADRNPERNVYWGDVHIHTRHSFDAWIIGTRGTPDDAYAFARGEPLRLPPLDENGEGTTEVRLDRPLDFAAVTDHSEYFAEIAACTSPDSPAWDTPTCTAYREASQDAIIRVGTRLTFEQPQRFQDVCDAIDCPDESTGVWRSIQEAADRWYDRTSECNFTTFKAYEYSAATWVTNLHRNVIFRNDAVPNRTTSYFEEPLPLGLWRQLEADCWEGLPGCDVLAIPHNSNWSNGRMFLPTYPEDATLDEQREIAALRAALEPVVEIFQHKGDSECMIGLPSSGADDDPLCDFEKLRYDGVTDCGDTAGNGAIAGFGCTSRFDFVRYTLKEGLGEAERIGINPYELGITAATDTHNATAGFVSEEEYFGHFGDDEIAPADRLANTGLTPGGVMLNPGGLTGVWAEENSRDFLFEAIRRREVFGTSGPRIAVRFFAGDAIDPGACDDPEMIANAYSSGHPMGARVPTPDQPPVFLVSALADPGTTNLPGTPLQRIQIIKGWMGNDGALHERVIDVVGYEPGDASVDLDSCETSGAGAASLCGTWTDPEYDPTQRSFYYARVVENPTCRWSQRLCLSLSEDERPENCDSPEARRAIQERAWTSPIWFDPTIDVPR